MFESKKRKLAAAARPQLQADAARAGWTWEPAAPPPQLELREAGLRVKDLWNTGRRDAWVIGIADALSGRAGAYEAHAGCLVGYAFGTNQGRQASYRQVSTNAVWLTLPASLPEIRFVDTTAADRETGVRLPPIAQPPALSPRWRVEGFVPAFATDVVTPAFAAALDALPSLNAVVLRAGFALVYGLPTLASSFTVATALAAILDAVPAACWGRADRLIAGYGVFPHLIPDGPLLKLDQRLIEPEWGSFGVDKVVPWQQAPDAPSTIWVQQDKEVRVTPLNRAANPAEGGRTLGASVLVGGVRIGSAPPALPTVAAAERSATQPAPTEPSTSDTDGGAAASASADA